MKRRIVFFHLLNDYSGSPHILALVLRGMVARGFRVDLYTSSVRNGFISYIEGVNYHRIYYEFSVNIIKTSLYFIYAQLAGFFAVLRYCFNRDVIIYVNTIYPFGAAIGAAITRKRLIYHVHENPVKHNVISSFALFILNAFVDKAIYVSMYLYNNSRVETKKKVLVYNSLSPEFTQKAMGSIHPDVPDSILMICSLRKYKGVFVFCEIASYLSQYSFKLVVNATDKEIESFFNGTILPKNLQIYSSITNVHPFYRNANLVLNLSIPDLCIEAFGLTVLEALSYGIPVIVPPVGGITELIEDGVQGFRVDSRNIDLMISKINEIFSDSKKYSKMSLAAKKKAESFSYQKMIDEIEKIISA